MAKSIGIDLGERAIKVVELDGSYRKTRLVRSAVQALPAETEDPAARATATAEAVKAAMQAARISGRDERMAYPSREAVMRTVELPFSGRDAIRRIIKSEVEGEIHSHSVDDMVVDFHVVRESAEGSKVLVAAVPKSGVRVQMQALGRVGIEPEHIDLDVMALYRLAHWAGAFEVQPAEVAESADEATTAVVDPKQLPTSRAAVLDLGARSTRILLTEGGNLVDLRILRLGASALSEEIARVYGLTAESAAEAVRHCLTDGSDFEASSVTEVPVPVVAEGDAEPAAAPAEVPQAAVAVRVHAKTVQEACHAYVVRLRRELLRFLTSAGDGGRVQAVHCTGGGLQVPGVREALAEVFGCEVQELDVLAHLQHDLSPEDAAAMGPGLGVAVGMALAAFGGPDGFELRQEDLAFTRGFDRIKFPLAILCMVALFATLVWGLKLNNDLRNHEYRLGRSYTGGKTVSFYGNLNAVLPREGGWFADPKFVERSQYRKLLDEVAAADVVDRIRIVRNWLKDKVSTAQRESGIYEELNLESGLAVLVRFAEMLQSKEAELGRYLITKIDLSLPAGRSSRYLAFTVAFRGSDFRTKQGIIRSAVDEECRRPDSPFEKWDETSFKEYRFVDSETTGVEGAYFDMRILVKDSFLPFTGTAGPPSIGALDAVPGLRGVLVADAPKEGGR